MQLWIKYLAALPLLFPAISTAQPPAYTYTSESLLDNQCVDTVPIGDGFGWDGICTCIANPADISYEWEPTTTLVAGQLIASTANAPGTCSESGSISIYEWRGDQPPVKTQELISSVRDSRDRFGRSSAVEVTDGLIASRSSVTGNFVTIFRRNGELWEEEILLNPVGISRGGFGLNMTFLDEQTLLIDEDDALVIYDTSDWSSPQVIPIEAQRIWSVGTAGSGFIVARALTNDADNSAQTDYFVREGAQYKRQQTLSDLITNVSANLMVSLNGETLITRQLDSSGLWVELPAASMEIEIVRFTTTVRLVDSQLIITNEDNIQIFNFSDSQTWDLSQQININFVEGPCDFGRCNRVTTLIRDGRLVIRDINIQFDIIPVTHTIFERDDSGMWVELSTITLVDSEDNVGAGFAPNRHFSLIENFALAEIPSGLGNRSTLAVFNLDSEQPAGEESVEDQPAGEESADEGSSNSDNSIDSEVAPTDNTSDTGMPDSDVTNTGTSPSDTDSNNSDDSNDSEVALTDNTSNTGTADSDATNTVISDSGGGAIAPMALLLILLNIFARRCTRRLCC